MEKVIKEVEKGKKAKEIQQKYIEEFKKCFEETNKKYNVADKEWHKMMQMLTKYKGKKQMLDLINGPIIRKRDQEEIKKYEIRCRQLKEMKEIREDMLKN